MNLSDPQQHSFKNTMTSSSLLLSFPFRDRRVPVSYVSSVTYNEAQMAIRSEPFITWYKRCERISPITKKRLEIHNVTLQSVDLFGSRKVGFIKIISNTTLYDGITHHEHRLPGICFLRGNAVSIFVSLFCEEEEEDVPEIDIDTNNNNQTKLSTKTEKRTNEYCLLVEQPRVPIGSVSVFEIPAGMIDDDNETVAGIAVKEMEEECGIHVRASDLIDLTELAFHETTVVQMGYLPICAIPPSPGGCDEFLRYMYLEKKVTMNELNEMKGRLAGLREHGEYITLSVVPKDDVWKVSGDAKAMISLFLIDQLRKQGKLPPPGELATCLKSSSSDTDTTIPQNPNVLLLGPNSKLTLNDGSKVPLLGYGLYQVPANDIGKQAILDAIHCGYRHFDGAAFYANESILGQALRTSGISREEFIITTKVWKDSIRGGRESVRNSVMNSIMELNFGGYYDICYIHWPVPDMYVDAYKELEVLYMEGKIRSIGMSNFTPEEYEVLQSSQISIQPVVNQIEVSAVMYRPNLVEYFQKQNIAIVAYKPLNRGIGTIYDTKPIIHSLAEKYTVSPAQIMLRWCLQKKLIVVCKTLHQDRMKENRSIFHFHLTDEDIHLLDSLTTDNDRYQKDQHEFTSKQSL